ncbi:MAG: hypothetical protein WD688_26780 [Candidatus Binatia bacterium]
MADNFNAKETAGTPAVSSIEHSETTAENPSQGEKKWTLKGMLMMAVCCAAPLLLLAAIPFLGFTFGSGLLSIVALLACPVGMFLMMRMMMKGKKEDQSSRK